VTKVRTYLQCGIEIDDDGTQATWHHYISTPDGTIADLVTDGTVGGTVTPYYFLYDHLGSVYAVCNGSGSIATFNNEAQIYNFDPWGRRRNYSDWSYQNVPAAFITDRGFTRHEHLLPFDLINMNGRVYDPRSALFLSPDPYIQNPSSTLSHNRYSYCFNNPLIYTDPSGEIIFTLAALIAAPFTGGASLALLPYTIGADIGMWQGGSLANGTLNPLDWDYSSGKTWGYMAGGAVVGAASGGIANTVATSGIVGANTAAIVTGSYINSVGTAIYTGGQTDVSVSFGIGSFNMSNGQVRGLWNWSDLSTGEKIGFSLGALANIQDVFAGLNGGNVDVKSRIDIAGHSWIEGGGINISVGPAVDNKPHLEGVKWESQYLFNTVKGRNFITSYDPSETFSTTLNNVNVSKLQRMTNSLNSGLSLSGKHSLYYGVWNGCVNQTSRALFRAGVFNVNAFLPITSPVLLNAELALRNYGMIFSYYITSYR